MLEDVQVGIVAHAALEEGHGRGAFGGVERDAARETLVLEVDDVRAAGRSRGDGGGVEDGLWSVRRDGGGDAGRLCRRCLARRRRRYFRRGRR